MKVEFYHDLDLIFSTHADAVPPQGAMIQVPGYDAVQGGFDIIGRVGCVKWDFVGANPCVRINVSGKRRYR